jgi:hypothetical protein
MFVVHETLPKKRKWKKLQYLPIKSPFLYGSGFFLKKGYYYAFIVQKCKKPHFLNKISSKNFKFLHGPRFDWCILVSYTKIFLPKSSTHNPNFEIYMQKFKILWQVLFCHKYTPCMFKFFNVCWII